MKLLLYSNCLLTHGLFRDAIVDIQRHDIYLISKIIYDSVFVNDRLVDTSINQESSFEIIIAEFVDFLIENDLAFVIQDVSEVELFPQLNNDFICPSLIHNSIIDLSFETAFNREVYLEFISQLDLCFCKHLSIRFLDRFFKYSYVKEILFKCEETASIYLDILLPCSSITTRELNIVLESKRVLDVFLYDSESLTVNFEQLINRHKITMLNAENIDERSCGAVLPNYFSINDMHYNESLLFNTCLNGKICVDKSGRIKNCPSMKDSFGLIGETTINNVLRNENYNKYWKIPKSLIETCKNCEFRNVCTDCSAFLEEPNNVYSKPLKCGYNIETGEWEDWAQIPKHFNSIQYYDIKCSRPS